MCSESISEEDRPAALIPPARLTQRWRLKRAAALPGYRLEVEFVDGMSGIVDLSALIASKDAGVFARLRDPVEFAKIYLAYGAATWPGEIDLAPDAMYAAISQTGEWKPA